MHSDVYPNTQESTVEDFFLLLKPRVMSLVVFTGIIGLMLAPGSIHPLLGAVAILAIAIGSGAAGAINMWYDRDIDLIMERTQKRPIPDGRMIADEALFFGIFAATLSVIVMGVAINYTAALLLAIAILFYVFVYTMWLKRTTPQNIVIGGAAGSFPPMIGWAAVTGNISLESVILFAIIFMWTPPHFWALSLYRSEEYKRADIPMLPVIKGDTITKRHIMFYSILLVLTSLLPYLMKMSGVVYFSGAAILGARFIYYSFTLFGDVKNKLAPKMFVFSIWYLFAIFTLLLLDHLYAI